MEKSPFQEDSPTSHTSYLNKKVILFGVFSGLIYGLFARLIFNLERWASLFAIISFSFIFIMPIALGFLSVYITERKQRLNWSQIIFVAVAPALLCLLAALALAWEGWICVVLWLPLFFVLAGLGGALAAAFRPKPHAPPSQLKSALVVAIVASLPFLTAPVEQQWKLPQDFRIVHNQIAIAATPELILEEIKSAPKLNPTSIAVL